MNKTKHNPHAWFFSYVKNMDGYNKDFEREIRAGIISDYSDGKTESLSELYSDYPANYKRMKHELLNDIKKQLDSARKRLIAVLFSFLNGKGYNTDMDYVKRVACISAKVTNFNDIPMSQLKRLYRTFGEKDTSNIPELEKELIRKAGRKENQN